MDRHVSVLLKGEKRKLEFHSGFYHCPFCTYKGALYLVENHVKGHSSVSHREFTLMKCGLRCRRASHFHCCYCRITIINRAQIIKHIQLHAPRDGEACVKLLGVCDAPPKQTNASQIQPNAPQIHLDAPQTQPDAPQIHRDAPKTQPDAPQTQPDAPQTHLDATQTQPNAPQIHLDASQAQLDAPQTKPDPSQTQPEALLLLLDAIENTMEATEELTLQPPQSPIIKVTKTVTCPHCNLQLNRKNFKMHLRRKHTNCYEMVSRDKYLACECIDMNNGVFAVVKTFSVPATPVHVIKNTCGATQRLMCEVDQCQLNADVLAASGMPTFECQHMKSILFCPPAVSSPVTLSAQDLETMVDDKWFGEARKVSLLKLQEEAGAQAAPLSVQLTVGGPATTFYVSVFEPSESHCSKLGRVVTEYDSKHNLWHCPCSEQSKSCIHKAAAKWHLFTTESHLFQKVDVADPPEDVEQDETQDGAYPPSDHGVEKMLKYILTNKKLPAELPQSLIQQSRDAHLMKEFPMHLIPRESRCQECDGELGEPTLITANGRILASTGVCDGISTYRKTCGQCHMTYRYQEWRDGVHNFDDHVVLSLHLCLMMRNALQTHTAISRLIETIEATESVSFPSQETVLRAYLHFEALSDHDYLFACVSCGSHPSVVVADLHRTGALGGPAGEIQSPPEDYDGHVDIITFWDAVTTEMLSRGLIPFGQRNPFVVPPSFHRWSPWIGPQTRRSNVVLNTEFKKTDDGDEQQMSAERLADELLNLKVEEVEDLCTRCGLDVGGSRMDLVLRLQDKMSDRVTFNKVSEKVWAASGGWALVTCPCGVVCSVKFNLRAESPRDYADLLLSWKHFPNVTVYDRARRLAEHTNRRQPDTFRPFEGRLANPTPHNVQQASEGELHVGVPWLKRPKRPADVDGHPITGSSERFALSDSSHRASDEDDGDVLRKVEQVPDLAGRVDSQRVEQLLAGMRENDYFLNTTTPSTRVFLQRNLLHHYNNARNKTAEDQYKKCGEWRSQECKRRRERIRLQEVEEVPPKKSHGDTRPSSSAGSGRR